MDQFESLISGEGRTNEVSWNSMVWNGWDFKGLRREIGVKKSICNEHDMPCLVI
jgi:hypothetical protein